MSMYLHKPSMFFLEILIQVLKTIFCLLVIV